MTRRLILTIVGVAAATLVVASILSVIVFRVQARQVARRDLRNEAVTLAARLDAVQAPAALAAVSRALRLEGASIMRLGVDGRLRGDLPQGLSLSDLHLDFVALRAGKAQTTTAGRFTVAAAPAPAPRGGGALLVLVVTRKLGRGVPIAGPWFLVALVGTLAFAASVAVNLSRRLTRPLRQAEDTTRRIAAGDLAARVPVSKGDGAELASLGRSVNSMAASLERSRGLERQFLLAVSHDLRTPLTSIRGFAEAIGEGRVPDTVHAAGVISAEARRLERLVADLLELAKLDARRFSLDIRATDLAEVTMVTVEGFRPAADEAGISLLINTDCNGGPGTDPSFGGPFGGARSGGGAGPVLAAADPDRLAQVLANLLENALKYAEHRVDVGVSSVSGAALLWVDDDGPGIPAGDLAQVFEPFYRSTRAVHRQMGSGLGLAIVAELVLAMGGRVRAESRPGEGGTRMVVTLAPWRSSAAGADGARR